MQSPSQLSLLSKLKRRHLIALGISTLCLLALLIPTPDAISQMRYTTTSLLRCSHDESILKAFRLLEGSSGESSLSNIVNKPMRVIFKDMATLNKGLKNYDALSWISIHGEQVIFINDKHRNAPPAALAAMIAHESMHADEFNSLSEEVAGWSFEAKVWMELKTKDTTLAEIPVGKYALVDRQNKIEQEFRQGTLTSFVRGNAGYQGLPETSPGFNSATAVQYSDEKAL